MPVNEELKRIIESVKFSRRLKQSEIAERLGCKTTYLSDMINGRVPFSDNFKKKIQDSFPDCIGAIKPQLYAGGGEADASDRRNIIPLYDSESIGGISERAASLEPVSQPVEYIDTGDWFRDATAAIRHYGESMIEYPSGCILAIREVKDRELIVPGRDYVIETSEYRVTKRVQRGSTPDYITAYSTNPETYSDGRLIHEPFDIPLRSVLRIFAVLGYVVKKSGGTLVFNNANK